ncbi:DUF3500 domain-containing protein [Tautonia plasticadhaerens]|uniref:DUF3500 domain-containing protein n=1 Tax=Tautonia plasticadhaerens TaxID=2527974 RepID=A0A518H062_9BACT|nr:DUF3500 domain-containing protein [Tautonia plasticadhaerens]QDV34228.1 hypothetical protein ElP_21130 [Tautonia plasticadhaerens]
MAQDNRNVSRIETLSRRQFVRAVGGAAAIGGLAPFVGLGTGAARAAVLGEGPSPKSAAETAAGRLFESLKPEQREVLCFSYDDPLRKKINANWAITEPTIGELSTEQQMLVEDVVRGVTSPEGYERFRIQMDQDSGGFEEYHIALFGEPGTDAFEFELTGRHLTLRADGNSNPGAAFGGPIVYGHGQGDSTKGLPGNVFYYQTVKANQVFGALDGTQRDLALVDNAPRETAVEIQGEGGMLPGICLSELASDQKELVASVIRVVLDPYRAEDVEEAMAVIEAGGGMDALHMAFYKEGDLGDDGEWDNWRIEGPTFVWHFRGAPHVHAYVNIGKRA